MSRQQFNQQLCQFLHYATTPFHAVQLMSRQLAEAGFVALDDKQSWNIKPGGKYYLQRNGSSLVAFVAGVNSDPQQGIAMVGAHTDSPCLMVKPTPEKYEQGYFRLGVEVYGGALLNPWFDRDLSLAGRVSFETSQGKLATALIDYRSAIATVPSLAIHLDREANKSRSINPQTDILPVLCQLDGGSKPDFRAIIQARLLEEHPDCDVVRILDYELSFYDTQGAALIGLHDEFIASARLDNLLSCYTGLQALLQSDGTRSSLLVCNDHEEVGSLSAAGAQGPLLKSVLKRLAGDEYKYAALIDNSMMISADNAHAIHPNFADKHDANHGPLINGGPVIKINNNQRYATNSETSGFFRLLAAKEDVPVQSFVVRTDMACGSTIGPITAGGIGVKTLDIGVPTFGMHSIRELGGAADAYNLSKILVRYFDYEGTLGAQ